MADNIASNWRALSGIEDNWAKLKTDPIDNDLRRYLVHYGQRAGVPGDSFNDMKKSKGYGLSLFPPEELFTQTYLSGNPFKYQVTDLIYARSEFDIGNLWSDGQSAFMGYVAVATDEGKSILGRRDILICWRGTLLTKEWFEDFSIGQIKPDGLFDKPHIAWEEIKVHRGFFNVYTRKSSDMATDSNKDYNRNSAREQVIAAIKRHVDYYAKLNETVSITVVGHSLGAALATLNSMDIVFNGYNKPTGSDTGFPVTAFVYASPKVGNKYFVDLFNTLQPDLHLLRITNAEDIIPGFPLDLPLLGIFYDYVGENIDIDLIDSEHVDKFTKAQAHQLHLYLYAIATYQGKEKKSELVIEFDYTYLNKYDDLLKDEFKIPKNWWGSTVFRHGMVQMDNGFWDLIYDYIPPLPPVVPNIPDEDGSN